MARPKKKGLDFFYTDTKKSDEVRLIVMTHGGEGYMVLMELFSKIYDENGYYLNWSESEKILFAGMWLKGDIEKLEEIVASCIKWKLFNPELFGKYGILTSRRIQEHYFTATIKRTKIEVFEEYLLYDISEFSHLKAVSSDINDCSGVVSDAETPADVIVSVEKSTQSERESERESERITYDDSDECVGNVCPIDLNMKKTEKSAKSKESESYEVLFEELWSAYPKKLNKASVSKTAKKKLEKVGRAKMLQAIANYKKYISANNVEPQYIKYGSSFFNSGYEDWIEPDIGIVDDKKTTARGHNKFPDDY